MNEIKDAVGFTEEDVRYRLTDSYILYDTLNEFGINVGVWKPMLWEVIYEKIMDNLTTAGYISKKEEADA